jgi:hypothetical protein
VRAKESQFEDLGTKDVGRIGEERIGDVRIWLGAGKLRVADLGLFHRPLVRSILLEC